MSHWNATHSHRKHLWYQYLKLIEALTALCDQHPPTLLVCILADADIFIVGNKCDRLKTSDRFTPSDLSKLIGHTCVGHVYTSAINQQGIVGLKQMILRSKSQLTAGHYQEFSTIHKVNGQFTTLKIGLRKELSSRVPLEVLLDHKAVNKRVKFKCYVLHAVRTLRHGNFGWLLPAVCCVTKLK